MGINHNWLFALFIAKELICFFRSSLEAVRQAAIISDYCNETRGYPLPADCVAVMRCSMPPMHGDNKRAWMLNMDGKYVGTFSSEKLAEKQIVQCFVHYGPKPNYSIHCRKIYDRALTAQEFNHEQEKFNHEQEAEDAARTFHG